MSIDGCIAMWEEVIQALKRVWHTMITMLLMVAYTVTFVLTPFNASAQANDWTGRLMQSAIPTYVTDQGVILPDWGQITFSSLPGFLEGGAAQFPAEIVRQLGFDPSMIWQPGDAVQDVIKMGVIQDLGIGDLNLGQISDIVGQAGQMGNVITDLANGSVDMRGVVDTLSNLGVNVGSLADLPLEAFSLAGVQSVTQLAEIVPGLGDQIVGDVAPIASMVAQALQNPTGFATEQITNLLTEQLGSLPGNLPIGDLMNGDVLGVIQNLSIDTLVSKLPDIAGLALDTIDLSNFSIASIPELASVAIENFPGWQEGVLSAVPGLSQIPMDKFPNPLKEGVTPLIARVDVPLDDAEQNRERSLSGSFQEGFRVPCNENCTHAELTPVNGSPGASAATAGPDGFINGRSWMSGKAQEVSGGYGVLAAMNGGKEPTGRNPYGGIFKQVIWNVDQPAGKVETTMWFRYCHHGIPDLGCTPYFLGPIPFITYPEMMHIYLGLADPEDDGRGLSFSNNSDPLSSQDGFSSCGGELTGEAVDRAIQTVDRVANALKGREHGGAFATTSAHAQEHIPRILAALREQGITCPAQVAYVLATVHRETSFVNFEEDGTTRGQSLRVCGDQGSSYWGRGYVQISCEAGYRRASQELGVDLVSNPNLARDNLDVAADILARGFSEGWFGNGRPIDEMIPCDGQVNYIEARKMINDSAQDAIIAEAATMYYEALMQSSEGLDEAEQTQGCDQGGPVQSTDGYINPLEGQGYRINSEYGPRDCRFHGPEIHSGIDLGIATGTPIKAAKEGTVIKAQFESCGGNVVRISHPDGNHTQYLHLSRFAVSNGATVQKGQVIGNVGTTGNCTTGPHLHYEFRPGGGSAADPRNTGARF